MKRIFYLFVVCLSLSSVSLMHSCKKETVSKPPPPPPPPPSPPPPVIGDTISQSYTEEFQDIRTLAPMGWQAIGFSEGNGRDYSNWSWGMFGTGGKGDNT